MPVIVGNLFSQASSMSAPGEHFEELLHTPSFKLERIVSLAHATPPGQWYDQAWDEWVVLMQGSAGLYIEGVSEPLVMRAGDYVLLPAHLQHRVEWTDRRAPTVWLALHYAPEA